MAGEELRDKALVAEAALADLLAALRASGRLWPQDELRLERALTYVRSEATR